VKEDEVEVSAGQVLQPRSSRGEIGSRVGHEHEAHVDVGFGRGVPAGAANCGASSSAAGQRVEPVSEAASGDSVQQRSGHPSRRNTPIASEPTRSDQ